MKIFAIISLLTALVTASPIVENVERGDVPDPKQIKIKGMFFTCLITIQVVSLD
jgi:hypothetical protein